MNEDASIIRRTLARFELALGTDWGDTELHRDKIQAIDAVDRMEREVEHAIETEQGTEKRAILHYGWFTEQKIENDRIRDLVKRIQLVALGAGGGGPYNAAANNIYKLTLEILEDR